MRRCTFPRHVLMIFAVAVAACGGDNNFTGPGQVPGGDPNSSAAGTYRLTAVNGQLPYVFFQNAAGRAEYTGGTMTLRADRSYTETLNLRAVPVDGPAQTDNAVENGTFAVVNAQVTFSVPPTNGQLGFSYTGTVSGNSLTYNFDGTIFSYTKQ